MRRSMLTDSKFAKQTIWLLVWGVAFAYIESSVVVYLRKIYYPNGFAFPLVPIEPKIFLTEVIREAATLVILWATASLACRRLQNRIAAFLVLFGIWDIFYYVFLKLLLDWPSSLQTWDILFLIPLPWAGPVWAPMLVAASMLLFGFWILRSNRRRRFYRYDRSFIAAESVAAAIIILSFIIPGMKVLDGDVPRDFPLFLFGGGYGIGILFFLRYHATSRYHDVEEL
ncbi:hypothetical protein [Hydrogenimonas urashimensis]|uniref:hypothetical protein n=1 Tax=Hydrogenimonas urashimensis TaxID=2740515 RepID=UPI001F23783A|nr:hypothetical protein [Hydrogenimonas urashimensis]